MILVVRLPRVYIIVSVFAGVPGFPNSKPMDIWGTTYVLQGVYSMLKQAHPNDILSFYLRRRARNIQTKHVFPSAVCAPLLFHIAPIKELSLLNASLKSHVFPCACCSEKSHVAALIRISFAPLSRLSAL